MHMRKKMNTGHETIILKVIKRINNHKRNLINSLKKANQIQGTSTKNEFLRSEYSVLAGT